MPLTFTQITQYQKSGFNSNHTTSLTPVEINGFVYSTAFYPNTNTLPNATLFKISPNGPSNIVDIQLTQSPLNLNQGDEGAWTICTDDLSISGYKGVYASDWRYGNTGTLCTKITNPLYRTNLDPNALNYGPNWPEYGASTTGYCCNSFNNNILRDPLSAPSSVEQFAPTPFQSQISDNLPLSNATNTHYKRFLKSETINNGDQFDDGSQGVAFSNNIQWFEDENGELTGRGYSPDDGRYYVLDETQSAANKWDSRVKEVVMFNSLPMVVLQGEIPGANIPVGQDHVGTFDNEVFVATILEPGVSIYDVNSPSGNGVSADNETTITIDIDGDAKFLPNP